MATKIAVLLSGGVDSSVALELLARERRYDITAYYLKIWLEDELAYLGDCPWEQDLSFARETCARIGVPLEVVPLQREYFDRVVAYALAELRRGRTPSPDIFCNQQIKFGVFADAAGAAAEKIATGHYSIVEERAGRFMLRRSPDPVKDQSYFLSHLSQAQLARVLFPVGALRKHEVRAIAHASGLPAAERPDSQGICFLGKIRYPDFVRHYLGERRGEIVEAESGRVLGEHRGFWFHTIGQRQGLGLGNGPWYVVGKEVERNVVYVSHRSREEGRARGRFTVCEPSWIGDDPFRGGDARRLDVKLRHGPALCAANVSAIGEGRLSVELDRPDEGVAPGQFTVFYDGDECLGGARIEDDAFTPPARPARETTTAGA